MVTIVLTVTCMLLIVILGYTVQKVRDYKDKTYTSSDEITILRNTIDTLVEKNNRQDENASVLRQNIKTLTEERIADQRKAKTAMELWVKHNEAAIRKDAIARSQAITHGFSGENFAPLLTSYNHKDFRHIGDPVDYLVIAGGADVRDRVKDELDTIILLDIKTGNAKLNTIQRRMRDAVVAGKVRFGVFNTDTGKLRTWPEDK